MAISDAKKQRELVCERRTLTVAFACLIGATVLWLIAMNSDHWCVVKFRDWAPVNGTRRGQPVTLYMGGYNIGVWRMCRQYYANHTNATVHGEQTECRRLTMYPTEEQLKKSKDLDHTLMHYRRSACAMSMIALFLTPLAIGFGWYSIKQPRYIYKRLAGSLQLIAAGTMLITIEVFRSMLTHINDHLPRSWFPSDSRFSYGFSFAFACVSLITFVVVPMIFFWASRKRKKDKARTEDEAIENEPVNIGRI